MLVLASRHQIGVPFFLLMKAGRKRLKAAPTGAAFKQLLGPTTAACTGGCTALPPADTPWASRGPSAGTRSSVHSQNSAQLFLAKLLAQLACSAPHASDPETELGLACSHTPATVEVCPTRQSSKLHLALTSPLFPDSASPPEVLC